MPEIKQTVAVIGGTGDLGSALALRWGKAGFKIFIGSRNEDKAKTTACMLNQLLGKDSVSGLTNREAASSAEMIVMTVPFSNHGAIVEEISEAAQGKIVVDTTVPLVPPKVSRVHLPKEGSIAKRAQNQFGNNVKVVSAFQTVAATSLSENTPNEGEVLVCGNNVEARTQVILLAESAGLKAWHAGPIDNSVVSESLTPLLIFLNKRYQMHGAGIRIVQH
jgi:NADPH-dependent F420 reductase